METENNSILKIYASTTDKIDGKLFYEFIVRLAKEKGINGVTVFRGIMGYGSSSKHISTSKFWELTEKLPVVIEMIDTKETLETFFAEIKPELESMPKGCLITMEPVKILFSKPGKSN